MDPVRIREAYTRMNDAEILTFLKEEGLKLSGDAFLILREELKKRNMGADQLAAIEHEIILRASINKERAADQLNNDLYADAIAFAFSQKEKGSRDYDIYVGLIEKGINEEYSNIIVNRLDEGAKNLIEDARTGIITGWVISILGVAAILVTIEIKYFSFLGIMLLLSGILTIIASSRKRSRYEKVLENIKLEEQNRKGQTTL
ncbi:hypothetical protein [Chitinophaga niabensis]|uniref:Uncharacterized protein n=1 Tax=Chitinophaga niabensis TaxID=536979 RepID=A0A1N6D3Z6_9BACT|nr:hypothetical protein [Chitinophaga niabensis]SIN65453.1 hypothetical protein SAMN04488055_0219 [Chitinophaga niabensis]